MWARKIFKTKPNRTVTEDFKSKVKTIFHHLTKEELIDLVIKNIDKNPLYYVEEAQFGIKGIGYTEEAPALGKGKMVKDPGVGGGYGCLCWLRWLGW